MNLKTFLYRRKEAAKRSVFRGINGYCQVLLYHRVIDLNYDPQLLCVSPDNFYAQLSLLKKKGTFLSMEEFCHIMANGKKFPRNAFLITFDDGYADNYTNALPVLENLNLEATFYIATKNIGTNQLFWWDEADLYFKNKYQNKDGLNELVKKHKLSTTGALYNYYITNCKTVNSLARRDALMNELRQHLTLRSEEASNYKFLTDAELKKLASSKHAVIGGHTVNHLSLAHLPKEEQFNEISASLKILSEELEKKVEHFSFPYGEMTHFNEDTVSICKDLKLKSAAANYYTYVTNKNDLHAFPRLVIRNDAAETVIEKLKQVLA